MLALLTVLAIHLNPTRPPAGIGFAFQDADSLYMYDGKDQVGSLNGTYEIRQWLPRLHAFLLEDMQTERCYLWKRGNAKPQFLFDASKVLPNVSSAYETLAFLDPTGRRAACYRYGQLSIYDLASHKKKQVLNDRSMRKAMGYVPDGSQFTVGAAWSADGSKIAVAVPGKPIDQSKNNPMQDSDGASYSQCILVSLKGGVSYLGRGIPVGWTEGSHVLCESGLRSKEFNPVIYDVESHRRSALHKDVIDVGWTGKYILLGEAGRIEVYSADLRKKLGVLKIDTYFPGPILTQQSFLTGAQDMSGK